MTLQELEIIINSNIPSFEKSKLIQDLYDNEHRNVNSFQEGGNLKEKEDPEKGSSKETTLNPTDTITIGGKEYDVEIAETPEEKSIGLSKITKLADDEGMLFVYDEPSTDYYTMEETSVDLDIVFIDDEGEVIEVHTVEAFSKEPVECSEEYIMVLEVAANSGIKPGDEINYDDYEFDDEEKEKVSKSKMLVLNSDGDVQMKLVGGERIVSMIKTRQLIKAALKAYKTDNDSDYRRVGKLILTELDAQDGREPQYTNK